MDMNEKLFALLAKNITGSTTVKYGETELDFLKMQRLSMREAIVKYWPPEAGLPPTLEGLAAPVALTRQQNGTTHGRSRAEHLMLQPRHFDGWRMDGLAL